MQDDPHHRFRRRRVRATALALLAIGVVVPAAAASAAPAAHHRSERVASAAAAPTALPAPSPSTIPTPPPVTVLQHETGLADGDIFITPTATGAVAPQPNGNEILDGDGRPVYFLPVAAGEAVSDFRVQTYEGRPVLTWWQGTPLSLAGPGPGTDYIADTHYHVIATINAGNGQQANGHEFQLTPWGTALITIYKQVDADLTSVGGPPSAPVLEGEVQEVDGRTGAVLFQWDSLDHVPVTDSHQPLPATPGTPWGYFHINAVHLDRDGNLLISARHTWAIYKVDVHDGRTIWELGGKRSSFALGAGVQFAWQHDPEPVSEGADGETIQLFDNESNGTPVSRRAASSACT